MTNKSMRILHVIPTYVPAFRYGGPIRSVHGLCKSLVKLGHEVQVYTTNVDGRSDSNVPLGRPINVEGVRVTYFPSRLLRRIYYSPQMKINLRKNVSKFDLLHLHSVFLWPTWVAARIAEKAKVPYLVAPRGMLVKELILRKNFLIKNMWIRFIEKRTLERASGVHLTTHIEAREIKQFDFHLPFVFVLPNGVEKPCGTTMIDPAQFSEAVQDALKKKPMILFLGRLSWEKGLAHLILAMPHIPNAHLVIAGNDETNYSHKLLELAQTHGVIGRTTFLGPVSGKDKESLLKNADLFALTSVSENFGNVLLEAMAIGCPVVTTPEVGLSEFVRETGSGLVVAPDPAEIGKKINGLIKNKELLHQMGSTARKEVMRNFTWDKIAKETVSVYHQILERRGKNSTDIRNSV